MEDRLTPYKSMVEFLGQVLGENCEIVLQDLSDDTRSIVAIANNKVSKRQVGAPLTDYALKVMQDGSWKEKDYDCNYMGKTKDGKILRSSTYYIKDQGELIGMLCINVDNQVYYKCCERLMNIAGLTGTDFLSGVQPKEYPSEDKGINPENLRDSVSEMISSIVSKYQKEHGDVPADHLSQDDKLNIVKMLDSNGIFLLKGAINYAAEEMCCSEASVYRYIAKLGKIKK